MKTEWKIIDITKLWTAPNVMVNPRHIRYVSEYEVYVKVGTRTEQQLTQLGIVDKY